MTNSLLLLLPCVVVLWDVVEGKKANCGCSPRQRRASDTEFWEEVMKSNGTVARGDLIYTKKDAMLYLGKFRAATAEANRRWPNNVVFYEMTRMNGMDQRQIRTALDRLSRATDNCVRFKEVQDTRVSKPKGDYVSVSYGDGACLSQIGRQGGRQEMSLGKRDDCLSDMGVIQHEFMHALGFDHEHSRKDRDKFITINWKNVVSSQCDNFAICKGCTLTTEYDVKSIMQYASTTFNCKNDEAATMLTKNHKKIAYNEKLQPSDVKKIKKFYKCS